MNQMFRGKWLVWTAALGASLVAVYGLFTVLAGATQTTPVIVFAKPVAANTLVTGDLLKQIDVPADAAPVNAVSTDQLAAGMFTRVAVDVNDPATAGVLAAERDLPAAVPPGFVVTSIEVKPADAVAGQIKAGDLVDVAAVNGELGQVISKVVLHAVTVLDVTASPTAISDRSTITADGQSQPVDSGPNSYAAKSGFPLLYTLAVSPEDFAKLAVLRNSSLYLALTSPEDAAAAVNASADLNDLFGVGGVDPSATVDVEIVEDGSAPVALSGEDATDTPAAAPAPADSTKDVQ